MSLQAPPLPSLQPDLGRFYLIGLFNLFGWLLFPFYLFGFSSRPCGHPAYFVDNLVVLALLTSWFGLGLLETSILLKRFESDKPGSYSDGASIFVARLFWSLPLLSAFLGVMALKGYRQSYLLVSLSALLGIALCLLIRPSLFQVRTLYRKKLMSYLLFLTMSLAAGLLYFCLVFFLFLGNFVGTGGCDKISSVKANMHTLQSMVESYAVRHRRFPVSVTLLSRDAHLGPDPYWKDFNNPYTGRKGLDFALMDQPKPLEPSFLDLLGIRFYVHNRYPGQVSYEFLGPDRYRIFGFTGSSAEIQDKGSIFYLQPYEK
jgi:hypothetical protein